MQDLWKDSNAETVNLLKQNKFELVSKAVSNKVSDLLDCEPIAGLIGHVGERTIQTYIEAEIIKLAGMCNINPALNLKDYQVPVIAATLIENFRWESLEDFTLCFRKGAAGQFGEIFRLDGAVLGMWMAKYLEQKYDALEQRKEKEKKDTPAVDIAKIAKENEQKYGIGSDYYREAQKIASSLLNNSSNESKSSNAKENAIQRKKLTDNYKYYEVRGIKVLATSQEHAEKLIELAIKNGDVVED